MEHFPFSDYRITCRLRRGSEVDKRHAPVWQAWGVLETNHGTAEDARTVFQQGIWACAQLSGGQSGGYDCARLWQAWGVLEAREGDVAAARRCFSRALDADNRNLAAIIAWTKMEESIGNWKDAEKIFERALKQFQPGSEEKVNLWRAYELMEQRVGNDQAAQDVFQRSMRETLMGGKDEHHEHVATPIATPVNMTSLNEQDFLKESKEVEVVRWNIEASSMKGEVWMNKGSIEGKVPRATLKKKRQQPRSPTAENDDDKT